MAYLGHQGGIYVGEVPVGHLLAQPSCLVAQGPALVGGDDELVAPVTRIGSTRDEATTLELGDDRDDLTWIEPHVRGDVTLPHTPVFVAGEGKHHIGARPQPQ